ncbi:hypothetical protein OIU13_14715 [Brevundimonas sp. BT-123]|uniref:hypothetical protein n=1 Tax=Brevundimonas sp. BT-123 TaxID=2986928 RepID=UPI0022368475|nr:hypothetical protein [Brevundimonas sp. BT-123]MCW0047780.1 hypothetical protein [Brevundimonas sp. BT-123]
MLEALNERHNRQSFCCGKSSFLDDFCRDDALADHDKNLTRVKVVVQEGSDRVLGYHSMCAAEIKERRLSYLFGGKDGPHVPAVRLEKFAADREHQGGVLSDALMLDVFRTAIEVASKVGACFLYLDAANERLVKYYEGFDFIRVSSKGLGMYIPIETMRDAVPA